MSTQTELIRRGLLAEGWSRAETKSGRECYTRRTSVKLVNRLTRAPAGTRDETLFVWLSPVATLRVCTRNCYSESRAMTEAAHQKLMSIGRGARDVPAKFKPAPSIKPASQPAYFMD